MDKRIWLGASVFVVLVSGVLALNFSRVPEASSAPPTTVAVPSSSPFNTPNTGPQSPTSSDGPQNEHAVATYLGNDTWQTSQTTVWISRPRLVDGNVTINVTVTTLDGKPRCLSLDSLFVHVGSKAYSLDGGGRGRMEPYCRTSHGNLTFFFNYEHHAVGTWQAIEASVNVGEQYGHMGDIAFGSYEARFELDGWSWPPKD